jgi:hypothetical protein
MFEPRGESLGFVPIAVNRTKDRRYSVPEIGTLWLVEDDIREIVKPDEE